MPTNSFDAIPDELRAYKQWILWRYEDVGAKKPTKIPYSINGTTASVTNPDDWSTFSDVVRSYRLGNYSGIGFVFSEFDPFAFIDLDDTEGNQADLQRQIRVLKEFDSYSEVSPSGNGLHIIVKGRIPQGRKRSHIEIYSSSRYATMTGKVYEAKPINDRHDLLNQLFVQMAGQSPQTYVYTGDDEESADDKTIIEQAKAASNGEKFSRLYGGDWQSFYPSQSEADLATIDIIAFYTQNRNQIIRIFRNSALGQRAKASRKDYIDWMINKSFDRLLPKIDFDGFKIALEEKLAAQQLNLPLDVGVSPSGKATAFDAVSTGSNPVTPANFYSGNLNDRSMVHRPQIAQQSIIVPPPGLLGEIAQFIYQASPRPVPEIAIAGAVGLMAGICGRAYNVSGTGLNQYVLLLAPTGTGKEAIASGIDRIINHVQLSVPVANEFIGPSEIASGQALIKYLSNNQSVVSLLGEFGLRLRSMSSDRANGAEIALRRMLLDLYNKSGHGKTVRPSIYADKDKNIADISAPAFSILGESTPDRFYDILTEEMISEGLLPRFMLIEYNGERPAFNKAAEHLQPPLFLIEKVATLMANAKTVMANRKVVNVTYTPEAEKMLDDIDKHADKQINSSDKEVTRQLWNRAHIKALKISALIAVGCNPINPKIETEYVTWAKNIVEHDIIQLSKKFETGTVGKSSEETKQIDDAKRMIKLYVSLPWEKVGKYADNQVMHSAKVVPLSYFTKRLYPLASYRNDKIGQGVAVKRTIQLLVDHGYLAELSRKDMNEKFGTNNAKGYMVTNMRLLDLD